MTPEDEAERLIAFTGSSRAAFDLVEKQLGILVVRTQVLLSLCGIIISVTGFSGAKIAESGLLARLFVVSGLFTVLASGVVVVGGVFRVTWLSQLISLDERRTVIQGIELREQKARYLKVSLALFVVGFSLYCGAIALFLLGSNHP